VGDPQIIQSRRSPGVLLPRESDDEIRLKSDDFFEIRIEPAPDRWKNLYPWRGVEVGPAHQP
jgi:hypothetical protein